MVWAEWQPIAAHLTAVLDAVHDLNPVILEVTQADASGVAMALMRMSPMISCGAPWR
jgi:hypothetical protein